MRQPGEGVGGFLFESFENGEARAVSELGILQGSAGIGLSLLAATTSIEPEWDRMLLTSIPPIRDGGQQPR